MDQLRARWRSAPRWKWLLGAVLGVYLLGPQPHVEWISEGCPPPGSQSLISEHRHLSLQLSTPRLQFFDLDFTDGRYAGFGAVTKPSSFDNIQKAQKKAQNARRWPQECGAEPTSPGHWRNR